MDAVIGALIMTFVAGISFIVANVIAAVTYPFALLHELEPTRYFSLNVVIDVDHSPKSFNYIWSCENERFFTGNFEWSTTWKKSTNVMMSKLTNESVVIIPLPQSCKIRDGSEYIPDISIVKNASSPDEIEMYPGKGSSHDYGVSGIVQKGTIHVLNKAAPVTTLTKANELLFNYISDPQKHYSSLIAVTYPKSEWDKYAGLKNTERFNELNNITTSTELANNRRFHREKWSGPREKLRLVYLKTIPLRINNLRKVNGVWHIEKDALPDEHILMKRYENLWKIGSYGNVAPVIVDYNGHQISLKDSSIEVYDPGTNNIIRFVIVKNRIDDGGYSGLEIPY